MSEREGHVPRDSAPTLSPEERRSLIQLLPLLLGPERDEQFVLTPWVS